MPRSKRKLSCADGDEHQRQKKHQVPSEVITRAAQGSTHTNQSTNLDFTEDDIAHATTSAFEDGVACYAQPRRLADALCAECIPILLDGIRRHVHGKRDHAREPLLNGFQHVNAASCDFCRMVLSTARRYLSARSFKHSDTEPSCETTLFSYNSGSKTWSCDVQVGGFRIRDKIKITTETQLSHHSSRPVPGLVDTVFMKSWLRQAARILATIPGHHSNERMFSDGFRLIDCTQECVAVLYSPCVYLTLSYVWGKKQPQWLFANTLNIKAMSEPGALSATSTLESRVPNVIREAMLLTVRLGHRYLWADALCIVQDNDNEQMHLISRMDEVYAGSLATIIVPGCEHADDVIPGVLHERKGTTNHLLSIAIGGHRVHIKYDFDLREYFKLGTHATRAWCLQEQVLSKSFLLMGASEASLFTRVHFWRESGPASGRNLDEYNAENPFLVRPIFVESIFVPVDGGDTITSYRTVVQNYSRRQCTDSGDVLNAFAGIYSRLCNGEQEMLPIGATQGIIPAKAREVLCWRPRPGTPTRPEIEGRILSSWAWVSRLGEVYFKWWLTEPKDALSASFTFGPKLLSENDGKGDVQSVLSRLSDHQFASYIKVKFESIKDLPKPPMSLAAGELGFWALCCDLSETSGRHQSVASQSLYYYEIVIDTNVAISVDLDDSSGDDPTDLVFLYLYWGLAVKKSTSSSCQRAGFFRIHSILDENPNVQILLADKLQWKYVVLS